MFKTISPLQYAHLVDREIEARSGGRARSSFSRTQRDVCDRMITDHQAAGSSPTEAASTIWPCLKTLDGR